MEKNICKNLVCGDNKSFLIDESYDIKRGVIILSGPSGCGKGEIGKGLCKTLSLPDSNHISMGSILRDLVTYSKRGLEINNLSLDECEISDNICIFDLNKNSEDTVKDAIRNECDLLKTNHKEKKFISQLDWLEFCLNTGLLIPDQWTISIIKSMINKFLPLKDNIFILDGYPRTISAAEHLLTILDEMNIPVIKVIHIFITKTEMKNRTLNRGREDDNFEALERRYKFYTEQVQPTMDYFKLKLGTSAVKLIDGHQPQIDKEGSFNISASISEVLKNVIEALRD
jgi:adenylate kinase family enzyme